MRTAMFGKPGTQTDFVRVCLTRESFPFYHNPTFSTLSKTLLKILKPPLSASQYRVWDNTDWPMRRWKPCDFNLSHHQPSVCSPMRLI